MIPRLVRNVSLSASLVYALTIVHHVYGAVVFDTPWRYHAAFLGLAGIAATLLLTGGRPAGDRPFSDRQRQRLWRHSHSSWLSG